MRSSSGPEIFATYRWIMRRRAVAFARRIAEISAGAGIHGRGEHEARGESHGDGRAGNSDRAVFERLAHDFEDIALELRQLVEEQHAIVAERDFAGAGDGAAADEASVADGVVRRAVGTRSDQALAIFEDSGDAVDARSLDGFFERHGRQDGGNAFGQHGLAGAGRTNKENVVTTGAGNFQRALGGLLAVDVSQIHGILRRVIATIARRRLSRARRIPEN